MLNFLHSEKLILVVLIVMYIFNGYRGNATYMCLEQKTWPLINIFMLTFIFHYRLQLLL